MVNATLVGEQGKWRFMVLRKNVGRAIDLILVVYNQVTTYFMKSIRQGIRIVMNNIKCRN